MSSTTSSKNMLFIYNPHSGKGKINENLGDIINKLSKEGYKITIYATQSVGDATSRVNEINETDEHYDLIICSGGDGTLNEVVKGIISNKLNTPLGYIPSGTVNDFARSLGIPTDINKALEKAINGENFSCDICELNNKQFTYVGAFGLFTSVAYSTDQSLKNSLGKIAYFLEGIKQVNEIPKYHIRIENENIQLEDEYIFGMITNSYSVGGIKTKILEKSKFNDGLFEVTLIKVPKTLAELNETIKAISNNDFTLSGSLIQSFKASEIKLYSESDIAWTLDGENGGEYKEVIIKNNKEALIIKV